MKSQLKKHNRRKVVSSISVHNYERQFRVGILQCKLKDYALTTLETTLIWFLKNGLKMSLQKALRQADDLDH